MTATKQKAKQKQQPSEQIVNDQPRTFTDADFPIGSVVHQGDLILVRISAMPNSNKVRKDRQLAIGTTQGSRHILAIGSPCDCDPSEVATAIKSLCPRADIGQQYVGPVFATVNGKADLLHPEHDNHHYRGDMTIAVVYQRSLDGEERERRVQD